MNKLTVEDIWNVVGPAQNRTKLSYERFKNLYNLAKEIIDNNISGDFIEAGTWKGGACALLGVLCEEENKGRKVWAFDSFEGMGEPNTNLDLANWESTDTNEKICFNPNTALRNFNLEDFYYTCFDMMKLKNDTFHIYKGWIENTMPEALPKVGQIALLRIDLDFYEPTKIAFEALYDKVVKNGYILCDDYGYWQGAKKVVDDIRNRHGETSELQRTYEYHNLAPSPECFWKKS